MRLSYTEDEKNTRSNELSSLKLEKERVEDELLSENKKLETELLSVTNKSDETTKQLLLREVRYILYTFYFKDTYGVMLVVNY